MDQKADAFLSVSSNLSSSSSPIDNTFDLDNQISPTVLLIITLLSIIFFVSALLHLLVRFLRRSQTQLDETYEESATALQGRHQTLINLHNSGIDKSFIDALPMFRYNTIIGLKHDPFDCAVCLSDFKAEDELRLLPKCSHAFHVGCIDTWFLTNSTCPLCRDNILRLDEITDSTGRKASSGETGRFR